MNAHKPAESFMVLPGMKPVYTSDPKRPGETRLPGIKWLPNRVRHLFISFLGEFVGTFLFLFFAFAGTQVANTAPSPTNKLPNPATLLYIALAFAFSLAVNVWVFFRISGGLFNPAVSVALALVGAMGWMKAALLMVAQILAGISAAGIVSALFPGPLAVRTTLNADTSVVRGLFIEMFLTAELIFAIFMLAAEKHKATFLAPIGIGLALFTAELAGIYFTGGSLNPARSFGPDLIHRTFDSYHWIYWIGPLLGTLLAVVFYRFIKLLEYETANPGADSDGRPEGHYIGSSEQDDVTRHASHRTDGTDESDFRPPIHPINRPLPKKREMASPYNVTSTATAVAPPDRPLPVYQHGSDGHHSDSSSIDHPDERPRAKHRSSSLTRSRSRSHSHHEEAFDESSDHSYRNAPTVEAGESDYSHSSRPSSRSSH